MTPQEKEYLEAHVWDIMMLFMVVLILTVSAFSHIPPHH